MTSTLPIPTISKSTCKSILWTLFASLALLIAILRSAPSSDSQQKLVKWQPEPPRRGTLSILSSSMVTTVACAWSIQYLNIPASWDSARDIRWRKIFWFALTILVPEMALAHAIVDRAVAVTSLQELQGARIEAEDQGMKWTLTHSYYANMGGLRIEPARAINTRQFIYLYSKKLIISASPQISEQEIKDKSKPDYFAKGVAAIQIFRLVQSLVRRARGGLAIPQLEIFILAFAVCAIATNGFSRHKLQGLDTSTIIKLARTFQHEEAAAFNDMQFKRLSYGLTGSLSVPHRPWFSSHLANGGIELPKGDLQPACLWLTVLLILFGTIHLSAWNFTFPTLAERIAWRIASLTMTILPIFPILALLIAKPSSAIREEIEKLEHNVISIRAEYFQACRDMARSQEPLEDFGAYMSKKHKNSPHDRERAADFEWYVSLSRGLYAEARRRRTVAEYPFPSGVQLIKSAWERRAGRLSRLEGLKLQLDLLDLGARVLFTGAKVYGVLRGVIAVLSFASLRRMPDGVYDFT
jgi:hypothetical protein